MTYRANLTVTIIAFLFCFFFRVIAEGALKANDTITFGSYEQDGNLENGPEPIEWLVLGVKDNRALLISKYILAYREMHSIRDEYNWTTSELRQWLNEDFFYKAFKNSEKLRMVRIELSPKRFQTRSIDVRENALVLSPEDKLLYSLLGMTDFKAFDGIYDFVICPNTIDISKLNTLVAEAVPALNLDSKGGYSPCGYWLRTWSQRMYAKDNKKLTDHWCIGSTGKERKVRAYLKNGVRPEILIRIK